MPRHAAFGVSGRGRPAMVKSALQECLLEIAAVELRIDRQCEVLVGLISGQQPTLKAAHELQSLFDRRNALRRTLEALRAEPPMSPDDK
jgi:hypothetical protein